MILLPLDSAPTSIENWQSTKESNMDLKLELSLEKFTNENNGKNSTPILVFHAKNIGEKLSLFVVSEKSRSSVFAGYSIITLYISVVLVVGKLIRGVFSGTYYKIIYDHMPNPNPLLKLCNGVEISRYENKLLKEGTLYLELIEILRSSELIKMITKSSKDFYVFKKSDEDD